MNKPNSSLKQIDIRYNIQYHIDEKLIKKLYSDALALRLQTKVSLVIDLARCFDRKQLDPNCSEIIINPRTIYHE
jgi:hypothetical protein